MAETNHFESGFEHLREAMDLWGDAVLRLARCRAGSQADAEDVFQTVFLRLYQRNPRFVDGTHLKAWLLRVTLNCCNDLRKSSWVRNRVAYQEDVEERSAADPASQVSREALVSDVQDAIDSLPETQRVVIHLFYFEGYSTDEIAQIMDEKPATVRSHLYRARRSLKISLGEEYARVGIS